MSEQDSIPDKESSIPDQAAARVAEEVRILEALRQAKAVIQARSGISQTEVEQLIGSWAKELPLQLNAGWRSKMTRRIDDRAPENWTSLGEWKQELSANGEA